MFRQSYFPCFIGKLLFSSIQIYFFFFFSVSIINHVQVFPKKTTKSERRNISLIKLTRICVKSLCKIHLKIMKIICKHREMLSKDVKQIYMNHKNFKNLNHCMQHFWSNHIKFRIQNQQSVINFFFYLYVNI